MVGLLTLNIFIKIITTINVEILACRKFGDFVQTCLIGESLIWRLVCGNLAPALCFESCQATSRASSEDFMNRRVLLGESVRLHEGGQLDAL